MKRVYLAGPDVFCPEPYRQKRVKELRGYCTKYGLEGVFPLDAVLEFPEGADGPTKARMIFEANVGLLRSCHGVLANVIPFRGPSLDVGTAWEMGFAYALGLPVVAYGAPDRTYKTRIEEAEIDDDCDVEDFELEDNLMPVCGTAIAKGETLFYWWPYDAAERLAVILGTHKY